MPGWAIWGIEVKREAAIIIENSSGGPMFNPMSLFENIIRRGARLIGWEIEGAIEGVMWSVGIGCFLLCCAVFAVGAVAFRIMVPK